MLTWSIWRNNVYYRAYLHLEDVNIFYYYLSELTFKVCDFLNSSLFHRFVCIPISNLHFNHCKTIKIIHIPYFTAANLFQDEFKDEEEYFDEILGEYEFKIDRDKAIELSDEFDLIYEKVRKHNNE